MSALTPELQAAIITAAYMLQIAAIAVCCFYAAKLNGLFAGKRRKGVNK